MDSNQHLQALLKGIARVGETYASHVQSERHTAVPQIGILKGAVNEQHVSEDGRAFLIRPDCDSGTFEPSFTLEGTVTECLTDHLLQ